MVPGCGIDFKPLSAFASAIVALAPLSSKAFSLFLYFFPFFVRIYSTKVTGTSGSSDLCRLFGWPRMRYIGFEYKIVSLMHSSNDLYCFSGASWPRSQSDSYNSVTEGMLLDSSSERERASRFWSSRSNSLLGFLFFKGISADTAEAIARVLAIWPKRTVPCSSTVKWSSSVFLPFFQFFSFTSSKAALTRLACAGRVLHCAVV